MDISPQNPALPQPHSTQDTLPDPSRIQSRRPFGNSADSSHVIIGSGARFCGELTNCTVLELFGYADGEFTADKVLVHEGGELHGRVATVDASVSGVLDGTVVIENKLDIRESGVVSGDLTYRELSVEAGGSMTGSISVAQANQAATQPGAQPAATKHPGTNGPLPVSEAPKAVNGNGNGAFLQRLDPITETVEDKKAKTH